MRVEGWPTGDREGEKKERWVWSRRVRVWPVVYIVDPAGNRIEHASSMHRAASAIEGGIRWAFLGASDPPSKSIDRCRITADKNPTPRAFLSDRLHFETWPPFHCALCTGSSANDWSRYCTLWIRAPTGILLTVEGTGTGIPRECDQQGAVSTTSLPARGLGFTLQGNERGRKCEPS